MSDLFLFTGVAFWSLIVVAIGWMVLIELLIVGFANSVSWHKWSLHYTREGMSLIRFAPAIALSVLRMTYEFWGYRNRGKLRYTRSDGGYWRGIGDWRVSKMERQP